MSDTEPNAEATRRLPTVEPESAEGAEGQGDRGRSASAAAYGGGRGRRYWSRRRVPAAIVGALSAAGVGLLLYDLAAVRAGGPAMAWRRRLAEELAERPLHDGWMVGGAVVAMVVGLCLLVLALTPGRRGLLPMRAPAGPGGADVRAWIDRTAASLVLRDRAMEVSGVRSVKVTVGRHRVRARAQAHFRDLEEVRGEVDAALAAGLRELGLARPPVLSLHVRRPAKR